MRNKYLAAALPATLALVLAAVYLPEQISRYQDRQLLDVPYIVREAEDRGELADSLRLAVPEKLMLLQEGKLNFLPLTDESASGLRFALVDGEVVFYESAEPTVRPAPGAEDAEQSAVDWSERLSAAQNQLQQLQRMGALPQLWSREDTVELSDHREVLYIDSDTQISVAVYYMGLRSSGCTAELMTDAQSGKILALSLRWDREAVPAWDDQSAARAGSAWKDYWGMDSVDRAWNGESMHPLLANALDMIRGGREASSTLEVGYTYNGQRIAIPLYCWYSGGRGYTVIWNYGTI